MNAPPPLQQDLDDALRQLYRGDHPPDGNLSLVWDRYALLWDRTSRHTPVKSEQRTPWLAVFVDAWWTAKARREPLLLERLARLGRIAEGEDLTATFSFATGLGAEHASENGLLFDPILGVPWLPGSSVKGLLRAAARALGDDPTSLLGSDPPGIGEAEGTTPGRVSLLGALPTAWPKLRVEIINPHHPAYQETQRSRESTPASLTEEPKPTTFLAIAAGTTMRFFWREPRPLSPEDRATLRLWLRVGLEHLGVGAKTASGMGHFG